MRRDNNQSLLIWLLALVVLFAPMQAAVSAIDMLDHNRGRSHHCQMDMTKMMDHAKMDHDNREHSGIDHGETSQHVGSCKDNCSACTQCISVPAMLLGLSLIQDQPIKIFIHLKTSMANGISSPSDYRPPRFIS